MPRAVIPLYFRGLPSEAGQKRLMERVFESSGIEYARAEGLQRSKTSQKKYVSTFSDRKVLELYSGLMRKRISSAFDAVIPVIPYSKSVGETIKYLRGHFRSIRFDKAIVFLERSDEKGLLDSRYPSASARNLIRVCDSGLALFLPLYDVSIANSTRPQLVEFLKYSNEEIGSRYPSIPPDMDSSVFPPPIRSG